MIKKKEVKTNIGFDPFKFIFHVVQAKAVLHPLVRRAIFICSVMRIQKETEITWQLLGHRNLKA